MTIYSERHPLVDIRTGRITREWLPFFEAGGNGAAQTTTPSTPGLTIEQVKAALGSAAQVDADELRNIDEATDVAASADEARVAAQDAVDSISADWATDAQHSTDSMRAAALNAAESAEVIAWISI